MSLLDIDERILELAPLMELVKSPIVDGKELPEVDVAVVEGAIGTTLDLEQMREIRAKAKIVVALGDCAITGNVTALRNILPPGAAFQRAYRDVETNRGGDVPSVGVPALLDRAAPLPTYVKVDHYIPGCPPKADLIFDILHALLTDQTPAPKPGALKNG
jgi:NAD-reducing hydrogenase small subunit